MEVKAYQIRDLKAGMWLFPFPAVNDDAAARMMMHRMATDPDGMYARFPSDYELYYIGRLNQEDGKWQVESPDFLCDFSVLAAELRKTENGRET